MIAYTYRFRDEKERLHNVYISSQSSLCGSNSWCEKQRSWWVRFTGWHGRVGQGIRSKCAAGMLSLQISWLMLWYSGNRGGRRILDFSRVWSARLWQRVCWVVARRQRHIPKKTCAFQKPGPSWQSAQHGHGRKCEKTAQKRKGASDYKQRGTNKAGFSFLKTLEWVQVPSFFPLLLAIWPKLLILDWYFSHIRLRTRTWLLPSIEWPPCFLN